MLDGGLALSPIAPGLRGGERRTEDDAEREPQSHAVRNRADEHSSYDSESDIFCVRWPSHMRFYVLVPCARRAASTRSFRNGARLKRTPVASNTAFATAAIIGLWLVSPAP